MTVTKRNPDMLKKLSVPFALTARLYGITAVPAVCPTEGKCDKSTCMNIFLENSADLTF
jgi:hypothetical protein